MAISLGESAGFRAAGNRRQPPRAVRQRPRRGDVVVWTCNHCPYALAWHDRIVDAANDYAEHGVRFLAVNSNDAERYPADSPEAMRERFERERWPFPYLWDETRVRRLGRGTRTVRARSGVAALRGRPDADYDDPPQGAPGRGLDAVLEGRPERQETWRSAARSAEAVSRAMTARRL
jgi:hypothetical protein